MRAYDKRVIELAEAQGDFVKAADGFVYFCPIERTSYTSHELRLIAKELDRRNENKWTATVNRELETDGNRQPSEEEINEMLSTEWIWEEENRRQPSP